MALVAGAATLESATPRGAGDVSRSFSLPVVFAFSLVMILLCGEDVAEVAEVDAGREDADEEAVRNSAGFV